MTPSPDAKSAAADFLARHPRLTWTLVVLTALAGVVVLLRLQSAPKVLYSDF